MQDHSSSSDAPRPQHPAPTPWTDSDIVAAIEYALFIFLPAIQPVCEAHDGIAILRGEAVDEDDHLRALQIAAEIPGVRHVIDRLTVMEEPPAFGARWSARPIGTRAA